MSEFAYYAAYHDGVMAERDRIVEALAAIHYRPEWRREPFCVECNQPVDSDGDCPTRRIAKGKA